MIYGTRTGRTQCVSPNRSNPPSHNRRISWKRRYVELVPAIGALTVELRLLRNQMRVLEPLPSVVRTVDDRKDVAKWSALQDRYWSTFAARKLLRSLDATRVRKPTRTDNLGTYFVKADHV